jgi:hypothetical protein
LDSMRPTANCWRDRAMHASLLHQDTGARSKVGRFVMRRRTENYAAEPPGGRSFASMLRFGGRPSKLNSGPIMKWRSFFVSITAIYRKARFTVSHRCHHPFLVARCVIPDHIRAEGPCTQSARDDHHNGRAECTHDPRYLPNGAEDIRYPGKK